MCYIISYISLVAASFAFTISILTPKWLTFTKIESNQNVTLERGVFYICELLSTNNTFETKQCMSIIQRESSVGSNRLIYEFSIACASLAITCAGISIIILWLFSIDLYFRKRNTNRICSLVFIICLSFVVFCLSFIVWILLISETLRLNISISRHVFSWPMWLAIGATGGYLISFIALFAVTCNIYRHKNKIKNNYYRPKSQF